VACGGGYAGHAEIVYAPGTLCASVPDGVGLDEAAFTTSCHCSPGSATERCARGERVAVIGLGLVGQITVQILRAAGCEVPARISTMAAARQSRTLSVAVTSATGSVAAKALLAVTGDIGYDAVISPPARRATSLLNSPPKSREIVAPWSWWATLACACRARPSTQGAHAQAVALVRPWALRPDV